MVKFIYYNGVIYFMNEKELKNKKEKIKNLLLELHKGKSINELKEKCGDIIRSISPFEIPLIEQELIKEGISPWEIAKLCDLHVEIFREVIAGRSEFKDLAPGHPLHTLLMENNQILKDAELLNLYAHALEADEAKLNENIKKLKTFLRELMGVRRHFAKLQMLIFPYLEKRGITAVPSVLWIKEDEVKFMIRNSLKLLEEVENNLPKIVEHLRKLSKTMIDMVFRENNILYPTLKVLLSESEWAAIKEEEEVIGYYKVTPGDEWEPRAEPLYPYQISPEITSSQIESLPVQVRKIIETGKAKGDEYKLVRDGDLELDEGYLSSKEIKAILKTLPVDISFIDKHDRLRFYSESKHGRIFMRTKTVLGRLVHYCHPPKSVGIVKAIIEDFKKGKRDVAEFWIQMNDRFIYIRYFPVRSENGEYLGTLEVVQDVTEIRKLEGEKRLLDWK